MKKLMVFLLILILAGMVAVELIAPRLVEARIEDKVGEETSGTAGVGADIDSFPFVTRLVTTGKVEHLSVTLEEVAQYELPLASVRFDADGVKLDRSALYERNVRVRDIESVTVTAEVAEGALSDVLGAVTDLTGVEAGDGVLNIAGSTVPLPEDILPCSPSVRQAEAGITLSCTMETLPPLLARALAATAG